MAEHTTTEQQQAHDPAQQHAAPHHADHGRYHPHVVSLRLLVVVFVLLLVLTYITVAVTRFDFGMLNLAVALAIAATKASLVGLYFMHLRWDSPFNAVALVAAFLFLALFLWFAIVDTGEYAPQKQPITEREGFRGPGG